MTFRNDCVLVRPDDSVLSKVQILEDLKFHPITFKELQLTNEQVRIHGSVGILTGITRTVSVWDGKESNVRSQMSA